MKDQIWKWGMDDVLSFFKEIKSKNKNYKHNQDQYEEIIIKQSLRILIVETK